MTPQGNEMTSTQKRIRNTLLEQVEEKKWKVKYELRIDIQDVDVINALIWKYLDDLKANDVLEYRRKYLGKDE
jgi:hypothetical protein